jgi:hypothetical protein
MMREIHSGAERTLVCLGDSEDSKLAIAKLLEIRSAIEYLTEIEFYTEVSELKDFPNWCALSKLVAHP